MNKKTKIRMLSAGALILVAHLSACTDGTTSGGSEAQAYVAYLDTCSESVDAEIAAVRESFGFEALRIPLDSRILSHGDVAGVVQVTGSEISHEELVEYANGIVSECPSLYRAQYSVDDPASTQRMIDFLRDVEWGSVRFEKADGSMGLVRKSSVYLEFDSGVVTVYFDVE